MHEVGLELLHLVVAVEGRGGGGDLVDGVAAQVGGQLDDDGAAAGAALGGEHRVGHLVGRRDRAGQATHLLNHTLWGEIIVIIIRINSCNKI